MIPPGRLSGWISARIGGPGEYKVFFTAVVDRAPTSNRNLDRTRLSPPTASAPPAGPAAPYLTFDTSTVHAVQIKIAISYVSAENAALNLNTENPDTAWNFDAVQNGPRTTSGPNASPWSPRRVEPPDQRTVFATALYHTMIHPNICDDANGQYRGVDGQIHTVPAGRHQYTHISGWDLCRTDAALLALLSPDVGSDVAQSLVNDATQDKGGGIPRWKQANRNSNGMIGDGNVILLANLYAFGARDFDTRAALTAMLRNADDPRTTADGHPVRPQLAEYLRLGYVPDQ